VNLFLRQYSWQSNYQNNLGNSYSGFGFSSENLQNHNDVTDIYINVTLQWRTLNIAFTTLQIKPTNYAAF
jgi:hypothetical protein